MKMVKNIAAICFCCFQVKINCGNNVIESIINKCKERTRNDQQFAGCVLLENNVKFLYLSEHSHKLTESQSQALFNLAIKLKDKNGTK